MARPPAKFAGLADLADVAALLTLAQRLPPGPERDAVWRAARTVDHVEAVRHSVRELRRRLAAKKTAKARTLKLDDLSKRVWWCPHCVRPLEGRRSVGGRVVLVGHRANCLVPVIEAVLKPWPEKLARK